MEQLLTCPISLENPTCQNLWCISKYQLEKMGYGMSLVTLQPQFKIFIKIIKNNHVAFSHLHKDFCNFDENFKLRLQCY